MFSPIIFFRINVGRMESYKLRKKILSKNKWIGWKVDGSGSDKPSERQIRL